MKIIIQNITPISVFEIITTIATLLALLFAIYQSRLALLALNAAKKSIDEDKRARQLSMLPKVSSVIEVEIRLGRWLRELEDLKVQTKKAENEKSASLLKEITIKAPRSPDKITFSIDSYIYKNMPDNLREIMMSGAQYFYDAMAPSYCLWTKEDGPNWKYAEDIYERYDESINALKKLKELTSEMIPPVILKTPASINDSDFIPK